MSIMLQPEEVRGKIPPRPDSVVRTWGDVLLSDEFLEMWTFIHAHGERHHFCRKTDDQVKPKKMHGRCIMQARGDVKFYNEEHVRNTGAWGIAALEYCEGISNVSVRSLHAWAIARTSRHAKVFDRTWNVCPSIPEEHVWYQGVPFDLELS